MVENKSGQGVVADHLKVVAQSCIDCLARPEGSPVSSTTNAGMSSGDTHHPQWEGGYICKMLALFFAVFDLSLMSMYRQDSLLIQSSDLQITNKE